MNPNPNHNFLVSTRRLWLQRSGTTLAGALGMGSVGNLMLLPRSARAADYKAIDRKSVV